jgi:hypothetical protein
MEQTALMPEVIPAAPPSPATGAAEFTVNNRDLLKELSGLQRVVPGKSALPILVNIHVQATANALLLTASDLDLSLRTACPAKVKREGRFTIPAHKLYDYARLLDDGDVTMRLLDNRWVQIRSGESRQSKTDWRSILRDFVAATTPSDYRFCPPNRRHVHAGLYLPSIHREGTGRIVIGVDTSGSIRPEELRQFADEIAAIAEQAEPEVIHVVYCDATVQGVQEFSSAETITLKPKGRGGTKFQPVFEWVETNDVHPVCLIYLTDLVCSDYPLSPPEYPVLWVTDSRRVAPFGETL